MTDVSSFNCLYGRLGILKDQATGEPILVLIGGCSRSGKSILSRTISEKLRIEGLDCHVVSIDAWLLDVRKRPPGLGVMERYDCRAIVGSINELLQGRTIYPPVYDAASRRRIAERGKVGITVASGVIIVEGVVSLALQELHAIASLKVYVNVPDEIRIERLKSFYRDVKKLSMFDTERLIHEREREEVPFIKRTSSDADIVIENSQ